MKIVSPNYGTAATADNDPAGGIAWMEKVANDGSTEVVAALDGTFGIQASTGGAVTVGYDVVVAGENQVKAYTALDKEKGYVFGKSMETIATSGAVIKVRLDI